MNKAPAYQHYIKDYVIDTRSLSLAEKGAWSDLLNFMWHSKNRGTITEDWMGYSRILGTTIEQTKTVISELIAKGICNAIIDGENVTCNANVTNCNKKVTLINRRMYREEQIRINTRLRVGKHRGKKDSKDDGNTDVTSPSPSPSPTPKKKKYNKKEIEYHFKKFKEKVESTAKPFCINCKYLKFKNEDESFHCIHKDHPHKTTDYFEETCGDHEFKV